MNYFKHISLILLALSASINMQAMNPSIQNASHFTQDERESKKRQPQNNNDGQGNKNIKRLKTEKPTITTLTEQANPNEATTKQTSQAIKLRTKKMHR